MCFDNPNHNTVMKNIQYSLQLYIIYFIIFLYIYIYIFIFFSKKNKALALVLFPHYFSQPETHSLDGFGLLIML